jgi:hypothetical protein
MSQSIVRFSVSYSIWSGNPRFTLWFLAFAFAMPSSPRSSAGRAYGFRGDPVKKKKKFQENSTSHADI